MNLFKKKKRCQGCDKKVTSLTHELRLGTADGTITLEICDDCSKFLNDSAELFRKNNNG